jgi:hypothetical protein
MSEPVDRLAVQDNNSSFCDLVISDVMLSRFAPLFQFQLPRLHTSTSESVAKGKLALSTVEAIEGEVCGSSCRSGRGSS